MPRHTAIRIRSSPIVEVPRFDGKLLGLRSFAGYELRKIYFALRKLWLRRPRL
jgi:hypothetical protein